MIKKEMYLKNISQALAILTYQIKYTNSIALFDINIIAEDFFKQLLNLVYGYNLINLNIEEKNTTAIDLGDISSRIAIQVTSDNTSTKIKNTINKFIEKKLYEKYEILLILIITEKKKYNTTFDTNDYFNFNKNNIIDCNTLLKEIKNKDIADLIKISDFLENELTNKIHSNKKRQANEIDTIIELIEFLSSNKINEKERKQRRVDPKHKIDNRFREYANFLKGLYMRLVGMYGEAVIQAETILGSDPVKSEVVRLYLNDVSNSILIESGNNPKIALEKLTDFFEDKLSISEKKYDRMAIKFYLISETIQCSVFPNEVE